MPPRLGAAPLRGPLSRVCLRCRHRPASLLPVAAPTAAPRLPSTSAPLSYTLRLRNSNDNGSSNSSSDIPFSKETPATHYEMFPETLPAGPPPTGHFPIDTRALRREFLRLQARAHPDLQAPEAKPAAERASALINEAYRTLADPLLRAQYLLSLRGVDVANDETLKVEEPSLLMTVLEAREVIEEAADEADLEEPREENEERIRASEEVLDRAFAADDIDSAKREAVRLRYWVNIRQSLDNWEKGTPVVLQH